MNIASNIFAIFLVFIGGFIFSYPLAIFNSGNCIIFLALKKKKDDENLLERKVKDEVSELARVFKQMAEAVLLRERRLREEVQERQAWQEAFDEAFPPK